MRRTSGISLAAVLLLAVGACSRVPSYVLDPDDMAAVMADMRMAEAMVSANPDDYRTEASKLVIKEAVYNHNGITAEQFDTSLVWYGHHMEKYQEVTEASIKILERRMKEVNAIASGEAAMSVAGDSVDLWGGPQVLVFRRNSPSQFITFAMDSDANWEKGDIYTLRAHAVTPASSAMWGMTMTYSDGTVESIGASMSTTNPARQELALHADSSRVPVRMSGWISVKPDRHKPALLDSLGLTRRRLVPEKYISRRYEQRRIVPKAVKEVEDSIVKARRDTAKVTQDEKPVFVRARDGQVISTGSRD